MSIKTYICPSPFMRKYNEDVNVSMDVPVCHACGKQVDDLQFMNTVSRGFRVTHTMEDGGHPKLTITYKRMMGFLVITMGPFTVAWIVLLIKAPDLLGAIFLLFPMAVLTVACFGKCTITVCRSKGRIFYGVGKVGVTKRFTYTHESTFEVLVDSTTQIGKQLINFIDIRTPNHPTASFMICRRNTTAEYAFIIATLRTFFRS